MMNCFTKIFTSQRTDNRVRGVRGWVLASAGLLGALLVSPAANHSAYAQDAGDKVVATINGEAITESELALALNDFGQNLSQYPEEQRRTILIDVFINLRLLAAEAEKSGMATTADFERRMAYLRSRTLRDAYFEKMIEGAVTEEELRSTYDAQIVNVERPEEIRARHILVDTEEEAKAIVEQLNGGADFAELAKEKSTGPSAPSGGDLRYFVRGAMVPAFDEAVFALEVGQISAPVQTQFGWHVIKLEEKRTQPAPEYAELESQLREFVIRNRFGEIVTRLKEAAEIEIMQDPAAASEDENAGGNDNPADSSNSESTQ